MASKLNFSPRDLTNSLEGKLGVQFRNGKERVGWFWLDEKKEIRFTIPHIHSTWGPGTINDIRKKSKLNRAQFADLIACPLSRTDFEDVLRLLRTGAH
jgi:mono/diheme cytochrome c family protein